MITYIHISDYPMDGVMIVRLMQDSASNVYSKKEMWVPGAVRKETTCSITGNLYPAGTMMYRPDISYRSKSKDDRISKEGMGILRAQKRVIRNGQQGNAGVRTAPGGTDQ